MKRIVTLILMILMCVFLHGCSNKQEEYQKALQYLDLGNLQEATIKLVELGDYKDSAKILQKIKEYQNAQLLLQEGELEAAYSAFYELGEFMDAERILAKFDFPVLTYVVYDEQNTFRTTREYTYYEGKLTCMTTEGTGKYKQSKATYYQYDEDGSVTAEKEMNRGGSDYTVTTEYDYDENGNKIYEYFWYTGLSVMPGSYYYSYDHEGHLIREEYYTGGNDPYSVTTYEYDENGQTTKITIVDNRAKTTKVLQYKNEYNDEGELISVTTDGACAMYEYDENGKLIHEIIENQKDDTYQDIQYTYDQHGNLLLKVIEKTSTGVTSTVNHVYEYGIRYMP